MAISRRTSRLSFPQMWLGIGGVAFLFLLLTEQTLAQTAVPARKPVQVAEGTRGMVVAETPLAAEVGREILAAGGNAVDAAVAVAFALTVTWPEAGNIAGGGFMLVAAPGQEVACLDYREMAPAAAHAESFIGWKNRHHARMAGVPGTVAGLWAAHQKWGQLPWTRLVTPSIRLAESGIVVDEFLAWSLNSVLAARSVREDERYAEFRRVFGPPEQRPWQAGDQLRQPDLARTLTRIAEQGTEGFYQGAVAELLLAEMQRGEGLITAEDLTAYKAVWRKPISGEVGQFTLFGAPPPSSGGIVVLQHLQMLEQLKLPPAEGVIWSSEQVHLIVETMRRGFRDRAAYLGDPDFTPLPEDLGTAERTRKLVATIDRERATPSREIAGSVPLTAGPYESPETTHFSIVDAHGMAVSNTYTLEESFGARIVVRGGGFLLNNEMGDFNWYPGYTNLTGTIGTPPNQIAPGKRMLSSQSPMIVKQGDQVVLVVGSPGGRTIINTVTLILTHTLLLNRPLAAAVDHPRFHHQWLPDEIRYETAAGPAIQRLQPELVAKGHRMVPRSTGRQGSAHCIAIDPETGIATGVADWRRGGAARAVAPVQTP